MAKTIGKSGEHSKGNSFLQEKGELGGAVVNKKSTGVNWEFKV